MLTWQVGRVKITRIVEMDLPVPLTFMQRATTAELRKSAWLYPHFVGEDGTLNLARQIIRRFCRGSPNRRQTLDSIDAARAGGT
jgi:hypothetical protein